MPANGQYRTVRNTETTRRCRSAMQLRLACPGAMRDSDLARTTRKPFRFRASSFVDVPIAAQNSDKGFGLVPSMHAHFPLIERRRAWADFAYRGVRLIPECELFSSEAQG